jgi:lipopolysaccharide exporter
MKKVLISVAQIGGGAFFAQMISSASLLIIAKLYTPNDFGVAALFTSFLSILTIIGSLRYEQAMLVSRTQKEVFSLYYLSVKIALLVTFLILIILVPFYQLIVKSSLGYFVFLIPISSFLNSWLSATLQLELKIGSARKIGVASINRALVVAVVQSGLFFMGGSGLIVGQFLGIILVLTYMLNIKDNKHISKKINFNLVKDDLELARKFSEYPKHNAPYSLLSALSSSAAPILFSYLYTSVLVGIFALAEKLIKIPITLLSVAIRQVLIKVISEKEVKSEDSHYFFILITCIMFVTGLTFAIFVYLFSEYLIVAIFGDEWRDVGRAAKYLSIGMVAAFSSTPAVARLIAAEKTRVLFYAQCFDIFLKALLFFIFFIFSIVFWDALLWYGIASSIYGLIIFYIAYRNI